MRKFTARSRKNRFQMLNAAKEFLKRAFHHDGVRRYGANTLWLMAEKVIRLAVGFSVGVYVARSLGPTQYGLLNYAISYVAIFSVISTLGLDQIVLRDLVRHPEQSDRLLGTTFGLRLAGTGIMLTLLAFSLFFHPAGGGLIAIIGAGYCCSAFQVIEFYFQSKVRSKYIALSQIIALLVVSGCKIWAAGQGAALYWFAGIEAFYMVLMFLIYLVFFQSREGDCRNWRFDSRIARAILTDSWPYLLTSIAGMGYLRIDQLMLRYMQGDAAVGCYSVAMRLVELLYVIPTILGNSFLPAVIQAVGCSREAYRVRLLGFLSLMFYVGLTLSVLPMLAAGLITVVYGAAYAPAVPVFLIGLWRVLFCSMGVASGGYLLNQNLQRYSMLFAWIGFAFNIGMNYILISRLGEVGAAVAAVLSGGVIVYGLPCCFTPTRGLFRLLVRALNPLWIRRGWKEINRREI